MEASVGTNNSTADTEANAKLENHDKTRAIINTSKDDNRDATSTQHTYADGHHKYTISTAKPQIDTDLTNTTTATATDHNHKTNHNTTTSINNNTNIAEPTNYTDIEYVLLLTLRIAMVLMLRILTFCFHSTPDDNASPSGTTRVHNQTSHTKANNMYDNVNPGTMSNTTPRDDDAKTNMNSMNTTRILRVIPIVQIRIVAIITLILLVMKSSEPQSC